MPISTTTTSAPAFRHLHRYYVATFRYKSAKLCPHCGEVLEPSTELPRSVTVRWDPIREEILRANGYGDPPVDTSTGTSSDEIYGKGYL